MRNKHLCWNYTLVSEDKSSEFQFSVFNEFHDRINKTQQETNRYLT